MSTGDTIRFSTAAFHILILHTNGATYIPLHPRPRLPSPQRRGLSLLRQTRQHFVMTKKDQLFSLSLSLSLQFFSLIKHTHTHVYGWRRRQGEAGEGGRGNEWNIVFETHVYMRLPLFPVIFTSSELFVKCVFDRICFRSVIKETK